MIDPEEQALLEARFRAWLKAPWWKTIGPVKAGMEDQRRLDLAIEHASPDEMARARALDDAHFALGHWPPPTVQVLEVDGKRYRLLDADP